MFIWINTYFVIWNHDYAWHFKYIRQKCPSMGQLLNEKLRSREYFKLEMCKALIYTIK